MTHSPMVDFNMSQVIYTVESRKFEVLRTSGFISNYQQSKIKERYTKMYITPKVIIRFCPIKHMLVRNVSFFTHTKHMSYNFIVGVKS